MPRGRLPGFRNSEEAKRKMSESHMGLPGYWTGKKRSLETRLKISQKQKGRVVSETTRHTMSKARMGVPRFDLRGKPAWNKGKHLSIEQRAKLREAWKTRAPFTEASKQKMRESAARRIVEISRQSKASWGRKSLFARHAEISRLHKSIWGKIVFATKPELKMAAILADLCSGHFLLNVGYQNIGGKYPDFVHTCKRIVVEVFGVYWHGLERTGRSRTQEEQFRSKHFKQYGYDCVIVWEDQMSIVAIKAKLKRRGLLWL